MANSYAVIKLVVLLFMTALYFMFLSFVLIFFNIAIPVFHFIVEKNPFVFLSDILLFVFLIMAISILSALLITNLILFKKEKSAVKAFYFLFDSSISIFLTGLYFIALFYFLLYTDLFIALHAVIKKIDPFTFDNILLFDILLIVFSIPFALVTKKVLYFLAKLLIKKIKS